MKLRLIEKFAETTDTVSFIFEPLETLSWQAGQYLRYKIDDPHPDERGNTRYFTIASAPFEKLVRLTTRFAKEKGSRFKENLKNLAVGAEIEAEGPRGSFIVSEPQESFAFIAGGIGITPFRAILLDLDQRRLSVNVDLFYSNRSPEIVFQKELEALAGKFSGLKIHYFVEPNRLTAEAIQGLLADLARPYFYISGPEPMVRAFEQALAPVGVPPVKIRRDYFPGYAEI